MTRRYQVFLSSTFSDLETERIEVTQALLRMQRCIPAGMEMFPASGRPPWDVITPVIDLTDYFVLVIAGRYGSTMPDGISYTEREYEYAYEQNIPILAFLHASPEDLPAKHTESDPGAAVRLEAFKAKIRQRHTVHTWTAAADLAHSVTTSLYQAIDDQPRPGWVRGDTVSDAGSSGGTLEIRPEVHPVDDGIAAVPGMLLGLDITSVGAAADGCLGMLRSLRPPENVDRVLPVPARLRWHPSHDAEEHISPGAVRTLEIVRVGSGRVFAGIASPDRELPWSLTTGKWEADIEVSAKNQPAQQLHVRWEVCSEGRNGTTTVEWSPADDD